jgi:toxin YoeB
MQVRELKMSEDAENDMLYWAKKHDTAKLEKIKQLISSIMTDGVLNGIGKPEQLKYFKNPPRYSRHITQKHRMTYYVNAGVLWITSARGHYAD